MSEPAVSEIFDPSAWKPVPGFEDLTDLTYHRAVEHGTVRIAFNRPEVRNAFRPHTVDELLRTLEHARTSADVGCVILTGNGPSPKDGGWAFCSGGDQRVRGDSGYMTDEAASGNRVGRFHVTDLHVQMRRTPKPIVAMVAFVVDPGAKVGWRKSASRKPRPTRTSRILLSSSASPSSGTALGRNGSNSDGKLL